MAEVIARRYAEALAAAAEGPEDLTRLLAELVAVRDAFRGVPGLHGLFMNPVVKWADKEAIVRRVFDGRVDGRVFRLLCGIFQRRRVNHFEEIVDEYRRVVDRRLGRHRCRVVSAIPLAEDARVRVKATFERITGYTLDMRFREDPAILGGLHVHIDDMVLDARFSRSLSALKERLMNDRLLIRNNPGAGPGADGGTPR